MELKHLRTFVVVAEAGSFTRAGKSLALTQAAVSQHIAALEKQLEVTLFNRSGRSISLTDPGRRLRDYAIRILELVDEAAAATSGIGAPVRGTLSIAASTVPAEHLLPMLLAEFREAFPEVHESIVVSDSRQAIQAVELGEADIGLVGECTNAARITFLPIAKDELVLVVSPKHSLAGKRSVSPRSLLKQPLIVREPGSGSRRCVEQALADKGVDPQSMNVVMEVNSNDAIRAAAERNLGVAFLSLLTVTNDLQRGRLARVGIRGLRVVRELYMVSDPHRTLPRATIEFLRFVEQRKA